MLPKLFYLIIAIILLAVCFVPKIFVPLYSCPPTNSLCPVYFAYILKFLPFELKSNCTKMCLPTMQIVDTKINNLSSCNMYTCTNLPNTLNGAYEKLKIYPYCQEISLYQFNYIYFNRLIFILEHIREYNVKNSTMANYYFVPFDLFNMNHYTSNHSMKFISSQLKSLPWWKEDGINHLIWSIWPMMTNKAEKYKLHNYLGPDYTTKFLQTVAPKAILILPYFSPQTYRQGFDISVPVYSQVTMKEKIYKAQILDDHRKWFLVNTQTALGLDEENFLNTLSTTSYFKRFNKAQQPLDPDLYRSDTQSNLSTIPYLKILKSSTFCLILPNGHLTTLDLSEALMTGCVPVIALKSLILPYTEVLDYSKFSHLIHGNYGIMIKTLIKELKEIDAHKIKVMRQRGKAIWNRYFSSMPRILKTALDILNQRIFPYNSKSYTEWNELLPKFNNREIHTRTLHTLKNLMPRLELAKTENYENSYGFTAVILTYKRFVSLFKTVTALYRVPSLVKILVIWNDPESDPPPAWVWPTPPQQKTEILKIIRSKVNSLNNRFIPFPQISTSAILSIDDDIDMLSPDEIEFGFWVWSQYPDSIVGYPSRLHFRSARLVNASQRWIYSSEWSPQISMILTGAAFYHKYYNHLYTNHLPRPIKRHIDRIMNCEDIAMNLLITTATGNGPIKVLPRQKFKCPKCVSEPALSYDTAQHLEMRSRCLDKFAPFFTTSPEDRLPLRPVEFRMDPLLYKKFSKQELLNNLTHLKRDVLSDKFDRAFKDVNFL